MALAAALPLELIHTILQSDYLTQDGEPDRRLLRACSLVCNAWSTPAQQLLFSNVVLRSERDFDSFRTALCQSSLANAVRSLRVVIDYKQPRGLRQHHLAAAIKLCPRVNSISLALFGDDSIDNSLVEEERDNMDSISSQVNSLRIGAGAPLLLTFQRPGISLSLAEALANAPITSFHLSDWSTTNRVFLQDILEFLPSVKRLSISGNPPAIRDTGVPCKLTLNHLRINFQPAPSIDFLRWLTHNSKESLTDLDLERVRDSDSSLGSLDHFATTHGSALRSLTLPSCTLPAELKHFQRCTNLRTVAFRTPNVSAALFKHLLADADPTPVEKMYLCIDKDTPLSHLIEFVRNKETLQSLVLCLWEPDVRKKQRLWGSLRMTCAVRGVELKLVEKLSEYKALIKSDTERV